MQYKLEYMWDNPMRSPHLKTLNGTGASPVFSFFFRFFSLLACIPMQHECENPQLNRNMKQACECGKAKRLGGDR